MRRIGGRGGALKGSAGSIGAAAGGIRCLAGTLTPPEHVRVNSTAHASDVSTSTLTLALAASDGAALALVATFGVRSSQVSTCVWRPTSGSSTGQQAFSLVRRHNGINGVEVWQLTNPTPATGATGQIVCTLSGTTRLAWGVDLWRNVHQASPIRDSEPSSSDANNGNVTIGNLTAQPGDRVCVASGSGNGGVGTGEDLTAAHTRTWIGSANNNRGRNEYETAHVTTAGTESILLTDEGGDSSGWRGIGYVLAAAEV